MRRAATLASGLAVLLVAHAAGGQGKLDAFSQEARGGGSSAPPAKSDDDAKEDTDDDDGVVIDDGDEAACRESETCVEDDGSLALLALYILAAPFTLPNLALEGEDEVEGYFPGY